MTECLGEVHSAPSQYDHGPNKGLPVLDDSAPITSYFEFWPLWVMYFPVGVYWLWKALRHRSFGLPLLANPRIFLGGMIGESKADVLSHAGDYAQSKILPYCLYSVERDTDGDTRARRAAKAMGDTGIGFPVVAKPDQGCRGMGVQRVRDQAELSLYLASFPEGKTCMLQALSQYSAEVGVFYVRLPNQSKGQVTSITLKYRACVVGDGKARLEDLIERDARASQLASLYRRRFEARLNWVPAAGELVPLVFAGSHCRGSIFRDGAAYITPQLNDEIDRLMQDIPEFFYGRLDIKFSSMTDLMQGRNYEVIELNGASSEQTHIWDSRGTLRQAIGALLWQYKTLFQIGDQLRTQGHNPPSLGLLLSTWRSERAEAACYPSTD